MTSASRATKIAVAALVAVGSAGAVYGAALAATAVPTPVIKTKPAAVTSSSNATFTFTDTQRTATFQCSMDGGAYTPCVSGITYAALQARTHTFAVRARATNGSLSAAASYTWTVDRTPPPVPTLTAKPADPTNLTSATIAFTDSEPGVTFYCSRDNGAGKLCTSPVSYQNLAAGSHTFRVTATDAADNTSAVRSYTWLIDRTPPAAPVFDTRPANPSGSTATFAFHGGGAGATYQCALDGAAFAACTSPKTYAGLVPGSHIVQVRAVDPAGNTSPAISYAWVVQVTISNFTIAGDVTTQLYPGASSPVNVKITNPYAFAIKVTGITMTPKQATTRNGQPNPGCDGVVNLRLTRQFTGGPVTVAAGKTKTLSDLGVPQSQWPLLTMPNLASNQDACKSTSFSFTYSGTATEVTP